jgi:hypothetical protein
MAQAVSRRHLTADIWVQSVTSPCEICGGRSDTGTGFCSRTSVSIIPPMFDNHLYLNTTPVTRIRGRRLGTFKQRKALLSKQTDNHAQLSQILCLLMPP